MLGRVGIDRHMQPGPADAPGDGVDQHVLDPDAGVIQLGLMARCDQRRFDRLVDKRPHRPPQLRQTCVLHADAIGR